MQVGRCDVAFLPNKPGAEAWVGRCPFGHLGGYTWVVEFERPRAEMDEAWSWAYPREVKLARDLTIPLLSESLTLWTKGGGQAFVKVRFDFEEAS